jgi:sugar/nucleoside kinase (ribokinase family)
MSDVICAGHFCVDIIPQIEDATLAASDHFLAPGRLAETGRLLLTMGGSVSNTGLALLRLGTEVQFLARLGDDLIANFTRDILRGHAPHLVEHLTLGRGEPSSYTIVISAPGRDRTFLHCPGTNNTFGPEDVSPALLAQTRLFHLGYPPLMRRMFADGGKELATIMGQARAAGATTSLDMAMPDPTQPSGRADWPALLERVLPQVHLFQPSVEELLYMLQRERYEALRQRVGQAQMLDALTPAVVSDLAAQAIALGSPVVLIKLGHRGLYLRTAPHLGELGRGGPAQATAWAGRELWSPCFQVQVVGSLGAGDATIAGFITALLRGCAPEEALAQAAAVGACNVEAADSLSGLRSWEETVARVRQGWPRRAMMLDAPGWAWDERVQLWRGPGES